MMPRNFLIPRRDGKVGMHTRIDLQELVEDCIDRYGDDKETMLAMAAAFRRVSIEFEEIANQIED